jgi:hypothetical protein
MMLGYILQAVIAIEPAGTLIFRVEGKTPKYRVVERYL